MWTDLRTRQAGAALLVCLAVAACGPAGRSQPAGDNPASEAAVESQTSSFVSYAVRPGDTLGAVSQRLQVPVRTLIAINRLQPPYRLVPGQHLAVPQRGGATPRIHVVEAGDTVAGLATRFQVPIRSLIELNGLAPPYPLAPGRTLILPPPRQHIVQSGDTVYNISRRYGVDQSSLVAFNDIPPPYTIRVGQRLQLPASVQPTPAAAVATVPSAYQGAAPAAAGITSVELSPLPAVPAGATRSAAPADGTPSSSSAGQAATLPPSPSQPAAVPPASAPASGGEPAIAAVPQPLPLSGGKFLWPVSGRIISRFGATQGGLHNDGINIAAPRGTPVRATENGVVAYSGNELRGFGNLLLIRHTDGWISAYAHNETLLVRRGDQVRRGQTIAHVGSTGNVASPQLHFELRRGAEAVDPLSVLGSQNAALSPAAGLGAPPDPG